MLTRSGSKVKQTDYVFGNRDTAASQALLIPALVDGLLINDKIAWTLGRWCRAFNHSPGYGTS